MHQASDVITAVTMIGSSMAPRCRVKCDQWAMQREKKRQALDGHAGSVGGLYPMSALVVAGTEQLLNLELVKFNHSNFKNFDKCDILSLDHWKKFKVECSEYKALHGLASPPLGGVH